AATLDRPCSGVSTLAAIAQAADASANTVSLLPAGRGEVFAQHFRVTAEDVIELDTAAHLSPERLLERYGKLRDVVWAGPGAHAQLQLLRDHALKHDIEFSEQPASHGWSLAPLAENLAQHIAALALRNHSRGETERADMLRAFYVRPSDAEINQPWR
ncbi:MAG TPA: hypothetical protein VJT50_06010, partial [Pyrinomonadaceae bacterium]|nr:hypothetical protein [Pyrinomonadaceae bacterium]